MTPAYTLRNVSFAYSGEPALRVHDLRISPGEIVGLVGPNGSGKTTLMHLLAFLEQPQRGEVKFFGDNVHGGDLLTVRRKVALLLQNPYLFHESVLANVMWGLRLRRAPSDKARAAALEALDMVGLDGFAHRYARSLSGGESQRVALARALVLDPAVLLLDEPFNHMDRESARKTEEIVVQMSRARGTTVVLTTHAIDKVHSLARTVIYLWQGRVVPTGPENLFKGNLRAHGSLFDTGRILLELENGSTQGDFVAIDPLKLEILVTAPDPGDPNVYSGKVVGLSDENGRVRVVVDAGERFTALLGPSDSVLPQLGLGTEVRLRVRSHAITVL